MTTVFNLGNFKGGHFHLISDENKILPWPQYFLFTTRCPTLDLARDHLIKKEGQLPHGTLEIEHRCPKTIFHGYQIVHFDPLNVKQSCPQKYFGMGYVKIHSMRFTYLTTGRKAVSDTNFSALG